MLNQRASNRDVKRINRIRTIRSIFACERISQPEIAAQINSSWPTVLQNVKELLALGLVQEVGSFESTGGRKPRAFAPVRDARLAIGLEITQNHVVAVLIDLSGSLLQYERKREPFALEESYFLMLGDLVSELLCGVKNGASKLLGVGISLPGIVDKTGELLIYSHVLGSQNVATSVFSGHIPYPCLFINDANAAGLAEAREQASPRNLVYLSLSNSVGGAILPDGALYTGDALQAGEFGHNTLVPNGKPCYCGKAGCLDAYCAATVLSDLADGNLSLFFQRLEAGDTALLAAWERYLFYLSVAVNNLRMSFDCDIIVGGYVGSFLKSHRTHFQELLAQRNTFAPDASYFKICRYEMEASAVGAALLHVEAFIQQL